MNCNRQLATERLARQSRSMYEPEMPPAGIFWRDYEAVIGLLKEKPRPVLVLVLDADGAREPFLREILRAMPKNEKLRALLHGPCVAMLLQADALPEYLRDLGAGSNYHFAVLSPSGLTPMVTFDYVTGKPEALVEEVVKVLESVAQFWS